MSRRKLQYLRELSKRPVEKGFPKPVESHGTKPLSERKRAVREAWQTGKQWRPS